MTCRENNNALSEITEILFDKGMNGLDTAISILINEAMQIERNRHLKAEPYERSNERQDYANGFKDKKLKTRIGALDLKIPQVRDGGFYPSFLEKWKTRRLNLMVSILDLFLVLAETSLTITIQQRLQ